MTPQRVWFFGVRAGTGAGHYLVDPHGALRESEMKRHLPAALHRLDGVWCHPTPRTVEQIRGRWPGDDPEIQGRGYLHVVEGWTVISWWDRSEDRRGGCCAVFLLEGQQPWDVALDAARKAFPREVARMEARYEITLAGPDLVADADLTQVDAFVESFRALHPALRASVLQRLRSEP